MIQIRRGVFETNSSSTHSLTVCSKKDYDRFLDGKMVLDWNNKLVDCESYEVRRNPNNYRTKEEYDKECCDLEEMYDEDVLPSGEIIVAFGYFGFD